MYFFTGNRFPVEEVFPAFLVAFLLSVTVIVCCAWVGVYLLKRKRLQRYKIHAQFALEWGGGGGGGFSRLNSFDVVNE